MRLQYYFFLVIMMLCFGNIYSQSYKSSLIFEGALLSTETDYTEYNGISARDYKTQEIIKGYSFTYSGKINLGKDYLLEFRTGIFFSDLYYEGLQLGLYLRKDIDCFISILGFNTSLNFSTSHGILNVEQPKEVTYFFVIGAGIKISKRFNALLSYYKPPDKHFGHGQTTDYLSKTTSFEKNMFWAMRLGIEFNL